VNVVIVYDISQSMTTNVSGTNRSRADNAEDVMHDFIEGLHGYQNGDGDNIEVSLVTFGPNASIQQTWTSDLTGGSNGVNRFFDDGVDGVTEDHNYGSNFGTNWDWALREANTLLGRLDTNDTDPTFVVFVTDGVCTKSGIGSGNGDSPSDENWTRYRDYYAEAATQARTIAGRANTTLFGIYAYGTEHDLLDDLIYYANYGNHRKMTVGGTTHNVMEVPNNQNTTFNFGATDTSDTNTEDGTLANYFNASDTAKLTQAIESIFGKIVQALGVSSAAISDGTTSAVETSSGAIANLLNVDESSYKYWLTIPVTGNTFSRVDLVTGESVNYTVTEDSEAGTCTITWGSNSVVVNGSVSTGKLRYQWTGKNALYNFNPPGAEFNGSSVDWDLSPVGTLLDGVTYSVTFDVYPSQTTLDYVADIKNNPYVDVDNPGFWGTLDEKVQKYITKDGGLITNTGATLSYEDTRPDATGGTVVFTDKLDPVSSEAVEQLALSKKWENELDGRTAEPVTLTVTCDGDDKYPVLLNSDNNWENTVFISIGIIRTATGTMEILAPGHDFTFTEPANLSYRWEMNVPTVRPMKIDGEITMLIKVDEKHPVPEDVDEDDVYELPMYGADGKPLTDENGDEVTAVYYVENAETDESAEESSTGFSLTAKNDRRSSLTLTKVISEGAPEGTPEDAEFEFALNIVNSKAPETEPSDDPDHESDYWVWYSVWDDDPTVDGATEEVDKNGEPTGWYYAPSGTVVTIKAHAGCSIRVNNLPTGSTYTITESDSTPGFFFESSELWLTVAKRDDEGHFLDEAGEIIAEPSNSNIVYTDVKAQEFTPSDENELPGDLQYNPDNFTFGRETSGTIETTNKLYKVVYTNDYETTDVTVTKAWVDDTDDVRPEELTLTLQREVASATKADGDQEEPADAAAGGPEVVDGVDDPQVTKNEDDTWTYTWEGLPMNDIDGNPYVYTVTEEEVPDDYLCDEPTAEDGGTITNKYGFVTITVEKVWDDDDDQDGIRPESVEVQLLAGQNSVNSWILSEEGAEEVVPAVKADTRDADVTEDDEENE
jgi:hypothetical protein